jgi:hypothetical protein
VAELAGRGIDAVAAGVGLGELVDRQRHLHDDVLFSIQAGMWGRHSQLLRLVAALRPRPDGAAQKACDVAVADLAPRDQRGAGERWCTVLELVPTAPLFRLRSAFLASPRFGDSLAHDHFLRLERPASRGHGRDPLS